MDTAKLFQNGRSQAIRLPKEYRFPGKQVYLKRVGNAVLILPESGSWDSLRKSFSMFTEDFMENRDQPPMQEREEMFP
ncbi:MAG TPA: type II toxin-antitoxin system VapB family antitoxin [Pirellulaceae bacterium]|nr:type II toxin-antitoxin system VapB family antitoxin [Pirellulaceae bacterium]